MVGEPLSAGDDLDAEPPFAPEPALAADLDAEPWDDTSSFEAPAAMAAEVEAPSGVPAIARAELRDTIEKIAWDAFGPITEKIVREAIARIEQVAWEVVPKLAETLIQEEIRRLKGGSCRDPALAPFRLAPALPAKLDPCSVRWSFPRPACGARSSSARSTKTSAPAT